MAHYYLYTWTRWGRYKHSESLAAPDVEAAHVIALKMARVLRDAMLFRRNSSTEAHEDFVVEIADETGQTVLTVPVRAG
jgi:hypothetical protein